MRGLSDEFLKDLKEGVLKEVLDYVKRDDTLNLCIRENYINIYYRGGSLYKISEKDKNIYQFEFDNNYCNHKVKYFDSKSIVLPKTTNYREYLSLIYDLKREMDIYFREYPKLEREFQQVVLRENNCSSVSNDTDYYIADIEYANNESKSRFDLVGVKWLSNKSDKKNSHNLKLAIMEMKYGDGSLTGNAGIDDHFNKLKSFINSKHLENLYDEIEIIFNQLIELGLVDIKYGKSITFDRNSKPEYIIIPANHKPASTILGREVSNVVTKYRELLKKVDVKIASSSNMGYGLYDETMKDIDCIEEHIKIDFIEK